MRERENKKKLNERRERKYKNLKIKYIFQEFNSKIVTGD